jgi:N-acetylglucosamine kinase-like BadF-type ATPase
MAKRRLLLGIDGGQTSTKSLLAELDGTVIASGTGPASDHFHIEGGVERNRRAIHGTTLDALTKAGAQPEDIVAITLGLTGAPPTEAARAPVYEVILGVVSPEKITILPDYKTNLIGAASGSTGVVLIAGGGAIGYGITPDGREAIAGGYGFLMGDEGSAFKIGLAAIRAASFDGDKRGEPTLLTERVCDHFQIANIREITRVVYQAGFERNRISLLTPLVSEAAEMGDAAAARILNEAGQSIGLVALGVIRQLYTAGDAVDVYRTGGVFNIGDRIINPLNQLLAEQWPGAVTHAPRYPPAVGAIIVAARSLGIDVDSSFLARVEATLPVAP